VIGGTGLPDISTFPPASARPALSIDAYVEAFNERFRDTRAQVEDGVVVIRPGGTHGRELDEEITLVAQTLPNAEYAAEVALTALDRPLRPPAIPVGGVEAGFLPADAAGNLLSSPAMLGPIVLSAGRTTLRGALGSIVQQLPHHGWIVMSQFSGTQAVIVSVRILRRQGWVTPIRFSVPGQPGPP